MKKILILILTMLTVAIVGCKHDNRIESAFKEFAKSEKIPNFNGISTIECTDTLPFDDVANVPRIEAQIDSVKGLLTEKIQKMTTYYGNLSNVKKQQLATEFARIGAEYGEFCVNNTGNKDAINALKDALDELSPYGEPLYIYHIIAKIGTNDISFYGFSCGKDILFVKANDLSDAMRKNEKLVRLQEAMMQIVSTKMVPCSMLIDDIDKLMSTTSY